MNKTDAKIVLENLKRDYGVCRTEREALEFAINLMDRDKDIFAKLLVEHRKEEYESELDAVRVGAMISRVADRFVE